MKSETLYLLQAIRHFLPDSEFSFENDDYKTIEFSKIDGQPPTFKQITDTVAELKKRDEELAAQAEAKKTSAEAKLVALGLTADDLKALGL